VTEIASAFVRIRPRVGETVRVLDVLGRLAREVGEAVDRASADLRTLEIEGPPEEEGDQP
jgi:hypothetical protein